MKKIFYRIVVFIGFVGVLFAIISFARGYRLDIKNQSITSTGILATYSTPKAAKVYVDGELKGVTDLNLSLPPGKYRVEIKKDGFTSWTKEITMKGEIVLTANALLFPKNPSLSPLTSTGVVKAINLDQSGQILLFIQSGDKENDGIYMFESTQKTLSFTTRLKPILLLKNFSKKIDLLATDIYFSPDYSQGIVEYKIEKNVESFLISLEQENTVADLIDTTTSKDTFIAAWDDRKSADINKILETFPKEINRVATDSFHIISFSPDETKMIYRAQKNITLARAIVPPLIGANQTEEVRNLKKNTLYMYDKKEDKNIQLSLEIPNDAALQWYADSRHLVFLDKNKITVIDYDGSNRRTVYSGPFNDDYFLITPNDTLIILTNLNPQNNPFPDIYEVDLQ